jgi:hypothetical protein
MPIPGTFTITATAAPTSESDTFAVTDPKYGKGSLRTVADITARNAITTARREVGMIVYVSGENKYYKLTNGTDNSNWQECVILTIDEFSNIHITGNLIVSGYIETDTGIKGGTDAEAEFLGSGMELDGGTFD